MDYNLTNILELYSIFSSPPLPAVKGTQSVSALIAMSMAPSLVAWPPMKPLAWINIAPGDPHFADRTSSRSPHHSSGSCRNSLKSG